MMPQLTRVQEVCFTAQIVGQPYDFKALFSLFTKFWTLDTDFEFSRKPQVDYFTSKELDVAADMMVGKDKKGVLKVPSETPVARITLRRLSDCSLTELAAHVSNLKTRQKTSVQETLITVGSRTADFWYTATVNNDGSTVETVQTRNDLAAQIRQSLVSGITAKDVFDVLLKEHLSLNVLDANDIELSFVRSRVTPANDANAIGKIAQRAARSVFDLRAKTGVLDDTKFINLFNAALTELTLKNQFDTNALHGEAIEGEEEEEDLYPEGSIDYVLKEAMEDLAEEEEEEEEANSFDLEF